MVIVIVLLVLAIMWTAGLTLPAVLSAAGLTYSSIMFIGLAALAICFMISPEGAMEGLNKAVGAVSSVVSGVVGGAIDIVKGAGSAIADKLNLSGLIIIGVAGFLGYKYLTKEDPKVVEIRGGTNDYSGS